jgi:hypothetical protein
MYPHERSLVKRMADKPFVLLGINSDADKDELRKTLEKEKITWRFWCDGDPDGPIARKWNVTAFPTIYVLDAGGVIRYRQVMDDDLDDAVDTLVKEVATAKKP